MAKTVQEFIARVGKSDQLKKDYTAMVKEMLEAKLTEEQMLPKIYAFAKQHGAEFSLDDLKAAIQKMENNELTDEQLEAVAGGGAKGPSIVTFVWIEKVDKEANLKSGCIVIGVQGSIGSPTKSQR